MFMTWFLLTYIVLSLISPLLYTPPTHCLSLTHTYTHTPVSTSLHCLHFPQTDILVLCRWQALHLFLTSFWNSRLLYLFLFVLLDSIPVSAPPGHLHDIERFLIYTDTRCRAHLCSQHLTTPCLEYTLLEKNFWILKTHVWTLFSI